MANEMTSYQEYRFTDMVANKSEKVKIRARIPYVDSIVAVKNVMKAVFDEDGTYRPYHKEYAFNSNLLIFYTNIDMTRATPEQVDSLLHNTDIMEVLWGHVDRGQVQEMQHWLDEMIEHEKKKSDLERGLGKLMNSLNEMMKTYLPLLNSMLEAAMASEQTNSATEKE